MGEDLKRESDESDPSTDGEEQNGGNHQPMVTPNKASMMKKSSASLLPHDSDFERDPREDESFSDRAREYERNRPPHHS